MRTPMTILAPEGMHGYGIPEHRRAVKRDLQMILDAAIERRIPLVLGSAGGSGGRPSRVLMET